MHDPCRVISMPSRAAVRRADAHVPREARMARLEACAFPTPSLAPGTMGALSPHERLCVAVRVADLSGVKSLAQHYRNRLSQEAPQEEASVRLAAILRYAELTQHYPAKALQRERVALSRVGMTIDGIEALSEMISRVATEARIIIAFGYFGDED